MFSPTVVKLVSAIIMCIVLLGAPNAEGAVSCNEVRQNLAPCLVYLRSGQGPTPGCCEGVQTLKGISVSTDDKRSTCQCIKSAAAAVSGISPQNMAALPGKCGVSLSIAVGPQIDCATIN